MPVLLLSTTCNLKMWQNVQAYAPRICLRRSHSKTCQSCRGWTFCQNSSPSKAVPVTPWLLQAPILFEMLCHGQPGLELIGSLTTSLENAGVCLSPNIIQYHPISLCLARPVWPLSSLSHGSCPDPTRFALQKKQRWTTP